MNSIEIFKTNVKGKKDAGRIASELNSLFPEYKISFDIDDCDKVLRVETNKGDIKAKDIIKLMKEKNVLCEVLNY